MEPGQGLPQLIEALSRPEAYPEPVASVEVHHTHISVVFLAGTHAYKIKKPVRLGFLDFSTLALRRHFCEEEVRLNRRLAPAVYLGVVPIARDGDHLKVGGGGPVVEWAVQMQRLPEETTLARRLDRGEVGPEILRALAGRLVEFHARAEGGDMVAAFGQLDVVAGNVRENFSQAAPLVGTTLSPAVHDKLFRLTEDELEVRRPLIESRAARGVPRDTHGDLHLDHVYLFPDRPPPDDLAIIDCIEFNERFRYADPVADMAFLVMDLRFHGRAGLADDFADAYFAASGDAEGRSLLPLYTSYRAAVRGKVEGLELGEKEVPAAERDAALVRARAHWLLALGALVRPAERPCLLLVAGLPGTGKSTLARAVAAQAGFTVLRSDVIRKELAGNTTEPLYTPAWSRRTYDECRRRAEALLFEGRRVLVDANFRREEQRRLFVDLAARWAVPLLLLVCRATPNVIQQRLQGRRGDASDADWAVFQQLAREWQEPGEATRRAWHDVSTAGDRDEALAIALAALRDAGLL
jgi:aminoglycoside phosphotransferase family enzyme/predicted kinase